MRRHDASRELLRAIHTDLALAQGTHQWARQAHAYGAHGRPCRCSCIRAILVCWRLLQLSSGAGGTAIWYGLYIDKGSTGELYLGEHGWCDEYGCEGTGQAVVVKQSRLRALQTGHSEKPAQRLCRERAVLQAGDEFPNSINSPLHTLAAKHSC